MKAKRLLLRTGLFLFTLVTSISCSLAVGLYLPKADGQGWDRLNDFLLTLGVGAFIGLLAGIIAAAALPQERVKHGFLALGALFVLSVIFIVIHVSSLP